MPDSVMPPYKFLATTKLNYKYYDKNLIANRRVGVPYTDEMVKMAVSDIQTQVDPDADDFDGFMARYPKAVVRNFDGNSKDITEMDALIAYMQMLGILVDFDAYEAKVQDNER